MNHAIRGMLAAPMVLAAVLGAGAAETFEYSRISMGTKARLVLVADDEPAAASAAADAFARLDELEALMSDWRANSELNRVNDAAGGAPVAVGPDLLAALQAALRFAKATDGAFDPTVGPVVALWREARSTGRLPEPSALARGKELVNYAQVELDRAASTTRLPRAGMRLDLGGIGKGIAVDAVMKLLEERGISRCLVDFGSSIAAGDAPLDKSAWTVLVPEVGPIALRHAALAFSGDDEQHVEVAKVRYSHIVDPRTGLGLINRPRAAVIAGDATTADALATAACVLGPREGLAMVRRFADTAAVITTTEAGATRTLETPGFAEAGLRDPHGPKPGPTDLSLVARRRELPPRRLVLEVAAVQLVSPRHGAPPVTLVGVTHLGSADLYRRLQALLDAHDLVLYESVMPPGIDGPGGATAEERITSTKASMEIVAQVLERLRRRDKELPQTLDELPMRAAAMDSRLVRLLPALGRDAWGRSLRYEPRFDDAGAPVDYVLTSLGADGAPGGKGEDADLKRTRSLKPGLEDDGLQADLAEALGLSFQLHAIDYNRPHWRYADMTMDQLAAALKARGVEDAGFFDTLAGTSLPATVVKLMLGLVKFADALTGGGVRDMLTVLLIELLSEADIEDTLGAMGEGFAEVILEERDQVAVDALRAAIERDPSLGSVAIFYGAAHLPDLAKRLREQLGYEPVAIEWLPAVEVDLARSAITESQLKQMRGMVRRALEQARR